MFVHAVFPLYHCGNRTLNLYKVTIMAHYIQYIFPDPFPKLNENPVDHRDTITGGLASRGQGVITELITWMDIHR